MNADKPRVLLVGNDTEFLSTICQSFEAGGFDLQVSQSGNEALKLFDPKSHTLVVADQKTKDLSGTEFIEKVKMILAGMPVFLLTGQGFQEVFIQIVRFEAVTLFVKPIDLNFLVQTAQSVVKDRLEYSGREQRKFRRIDTDLELLIGSMGTGKIVNLSAGGFCAKLPGTLPEKTTINTVIPGLWDKPIAVETVWQRPNPSDPKLPNLMGGRFQTPPAPLLTTLAKYIFQKIKDKYLINRKK